MNNVLLVGNGFDLAHDLATSYNIFLATIKNWEAVYESIKSRGVNSDGEIKEAFYACISGIELSNIEELNRIINKNSWVKYFCRCEAEIDGWIDFEREIYPVISLFETVFKVDYVVDDIGEYPYGEAHLPKEYISQHEYRIAGLWEEFFDTSYYDYLCIKAPYVSVQYGILKKKILYSLKNEFDEFIKAFEIYLYEFVNKRENIYTLKQIKEINANYVISFNYTLTEKLYGIGRENVHHIHGVIREDLSDGKNNMVVGVNEQQDNSIDFIYFVKYFQRIQKASGVKYKEFVDRYNTNEFGMRIRENYCLHVYGHSLDETDEDILRYVIGYVNEDGKLKMKPKKVVVYYYNDTDYEQKVINLIKLYGRSIVEEYMEKGLFEFIPTSKEVCNV